MALKTKKITIEKGRDAGTTFLLTEMPVIKADRWATKALLALAATGIDVPDASVGILGLTKVALSAFKQISEEKFIELSEELLAECVQIVTESGATRPLDLNINDVQDISTLWTLRKEALMLHIDFLLQGLTPISE